ncbi:Protein-like protein [Hapsidospora chrysogenum ATCC 11550]|uniref:Protein-like protein n=1 Tax=Hapsidospora chrysogenum (strain ATCC 11550 / CBS 779.69 / DSM 880 / IAM 14645 / JCM 23072 / IMI 49137) TaxID=857340 RepID=A0A086TAJ3_HAPC1|nr:Protein-like protein [Hapsidospora chrysogenum ATCC 11550]
MSSSTTPTSVALYGATGLTGSHILSALLAGPNSFWQTVHTITRRSPKSTGATLNAIIESDTTKYAPALAQLTPPPSVVISALATTRAQAGGIQQQWKIDHDLNVEIARAAKEAGAKTYVFVSSAGTRGPGHTYMPYARMKNGVEDAIKELDFETAVIVKPAMILGQREKARTLEWMLQKAVRGVGALSPGLKDSLGQEADVIGRAAAKAAQIAAEGKAPSKYWIVDTNEILKLGRSEAKAETKPEGQEEAQK